MNNIVKPVACKILEVKRESLHEYTFKVATDIKPEHGQFLQLSIPKVGEAPISVSSFGDGWMDFTIRSVGKEAGRRYLIPSRRLRKRLAGREVPGQACGSYHRRYWSGSCKEHVKHVL